MSQPNNRPWCFLFILIHFYMRLPTNMSVGQYAEDLYIYQLNLNPSHLQKTNNGFRFYFNLVRREPQLFAGISIFYRHQNALLNVKTQVAAAIDDVYAVTWRTISKRAQQHARAPWASHTWYRNQWCAVHWGR